MAIFDKPLLLPIRAAICREAEMVSQGRMVRVMVLLMAAMTAGALVLLALEGKPIKPMAFSLSSQTRLRSAHVALATKAAIEPGRWEDQIEVSYACNNGALSSQVGPALSMNYHFVISDGSVGQDGQIFATTRWTKQLGCPVPGDSPQANHTIRICLICDGAPADPSPRQRQQLETLVCSLGKHCQTEPKIKWLKQ